MKLMGKVALVTGASRGIGAATAKILAKHGAAVAVNYFNSKEAADKIVEDIISDGGKAIAVKADVRDPEAINKIVSDTVDQLAPIDILILNAGMNVPLKPFMELTYDEFKTKVMGEMDCFFHALKAVVPSMMDRRSGCIIGISSGLSRHPGHRFSAHTTAKSAIDGLMKSLALELGRYGIRVNTIAPGLTRTDATAFQPEEQFEHVARMTPLGRVAEPEDIAGVVLMCCTEEAGFLNGAYIPVSGGIQML